MRAVFVIDVDEDELGKAYATITAEENDITFFARGVIRPLPNSFGVDIDDPYAIGWNACLNRILGDTK